MSIVPERYEETTVHAPGGKLFADYTASALGQTPGYHGQVLRGVMHWVERLSQMERVSLTGHHGLAVGDVDGDGREDLYVADEGGLPNRLYVQQSDGTVKDVSAAADVDWLDHSFAALLVDLDNDSDSDLVVASFPNLLVAQNDGKGHFTLRASIAAAEQAFGLSAADYDNDGDLDLYLVVYGSGGVRSVSSF